MIKALALVLVAGCVGVTPPTPPPPADPPPADPTPTPAPVGSGSGSGSAAPVALTATTFLHARNVKLCDEEFACRASYPATNGVSFEQMYGGTVADCYSYADAADQPSAVESEITANHITFSATLAQTCVSGIAFPATCDLFWQSGATYPSECSGALRGLVADGDPCVVDYDCLNSDSYCPQGTLVCTQGAKP